MDSADVSVDPRDADQLAPPHERIEIIGDAIIIRQPGGDVRTLDIGSPQAFELLSRLWLRSGWDNKHVYSFTWLGRPIIQLPEDMFRLQELIYRIRPDVIIETGVAHGGSLVFYAGLCRLMGNGRVIGVDIDIRPCNRQAIETHELSSLITLIEGSSIEPEVLARIRVGIEPRQTVMVMLDSSHSKDHVRAELEHFASIVSIGSYIVAMDGIMQDLAGAPRSNPDWTWNNPQQAVREFLAANDRFVLDEPRFAFNEGTVTRRVTYWPSAYLRRTR